MLQWPREAINSMIERAILDAEMKGVKVLKSRPTKSNKQIQVFMCIY